MFSKKYFARLIAAAFMCAPMVCMAAAWDQKLVELANNLRIGLYAVGGTLAVGALGWSGIKWMISRANGDQSHTFMDYMQQAIVTMAVGGSMLLGAGAWQIFGSGSPL